MYLVRIEIAFDAGHRLLDYRGKCAFPHGHSYRAEVLVTKQELDDLGLAVDFTDLAKLAVTALVERMRSNHSLPDRELHCRYELIVGESSQPRT